MTDSDSQEASPVEKIGVFGGSFNPPHVAHLLLAEQIREQFSLDKILWVPGYVPPHKQHKQLASPEVRLKMVSLAVESNETFEVSDLEIKREGISFTVDTLEQLSNEYKDAELFLIVGGDSYANFETWYRPEDIVRMARLIVYKRGSRKVLPSSFDEHALFAEGPAMEISSTRVRQRIRDGRSVRYVLTDAVRRFVLDEGLYS